MQGRRLLLASLIVLLAVGSAAPSQSQSWPQRPVRIIVPFGAGGNSDAVARIIALRLGDVMGQHLVVENRAGASGALAVEAVARSPPDGYALFMATVAQIAILPAVTKTSYDVPKDFAPISIIGTNPFVLVVHPRMPVHTIAEFVEHVRTQPGRLTFASSGVGSMAHLSVSLFLKRAALDMIAVSYTGGTVPLTDIIAGHVNAYFANLAAVSPHATSGTIRLLAVSSDRRVANIPDVPTLIEAGFPGFKAVTWSGLMAPAGTPKEIIGRLAMR